MSEKIIQLNEDAIKGELGEMVRQSVEDTLNAMLDEEADRLTNARRYERTDGRKDTRAGSYRRQLLTKAGAVDLKVPRLRTLPFETAMIERYKRREISVEETLVEMYLAGVSVHRVEDITEELYGAPESVLGRSVSSIRRCMSRLKNGAIASCRSAIPTFIWTRYT